MNERRVECFFYGLFMDPEILREQGVGASNVRRAYVDEFALRIGNRATLIRSSGARAYGMLVALSHRELDRLYGSPGLEQYQPEAILARSFEGDFVPALCYNLLTEPGIEERNPQYAVRLQKTLRNLGFPADYADLVSGS